MPAMPTAFVQSTTGCLFKGTKRDLAMQVQYLVRVDTQTPGVIWEYANWRGRMIWRRATARGGH